jgi:hypothetical protein
MLVEQVKFLGGESAPIPQDRYCRGHGEFLVSQKRSRELRPLADFEPGPEPPVSPGD